MYGANGTPIEQPQGAGALSPGAMLAVDAGNGEVDLARDSTSPSQPLAVSPT